MTFRIAAFLAATLTATTVATPSSAQDKSFYEGKTLEILVGFSVGGGYDTYARALAQFIGKHIPGNPTVYVTNMPGAGSLKLVGYLDEVAEPDGLTIGTFDSPLIIAPLLRPQEAKFDASKLSWIGSIAQNTAICALWHEADITSFDDLFDRERPVILGATGNVDVRYMYSALLKNMMGADLDILLGYRGSSDVRLAMEQGEIAGSCGESWSSLKSTATEWLEEKKVDIVAQFGNAPNPELEGVPMASDRAETKEQRDAMRLLFAPQSAGRPYVAPPGVPAERLEILRDAFKATMEDPEFQEYAKGINLEISPTSGADIQALIEEVYQTDPATVEALSAAIK